MKSMDVSELCIETDPRTGKKVINKKYRILKKIGQGQFGKVLLADNVLNKSRQSNEPQYFAIKTIRRVDKTRLITKTYLSHTTKIKREIQIMKECLHPNVVKLYQVIDDLKYDKILLVLENCPYGELNWKRYNHYEEKSKKDGIPLNKVLRDVVNGLEYLHVCKNIIHRDLKPSNLLISEDRRIKISDFGVSLILENNANDAKELGKNMGTPAFFAPELCQFVNHRFSFIHDAFKAKHKIDGRIDLWSLGVTLYCLIFNDLPFNGSNEFDLFKNIVNNDLKFPESHNAALSSKDKEEFVLLKDLISKLLIKDPSERICLTDIKKHPFTTFDLTFKEAAGFQSFNQEYIERENNLTSKIRKLFTKTSFGSSQNANNHEEPRADLEPVDDLLDTYFEDDTSLGSLEDEDSSCDGDDDRRISMSNMLDSLKLGDSAPIIPEPKRDEIRREKENYGKKDLHDTSPLSLPLSAHDKSKSPLPRSTSGASINLHATLPLGDLYPSSISQSAARSPSRSILSRDRDNYKATNSSSFRSMSGSQHAQVQKHPEKAKSHLTDLMEPPPIFGGGSMNSLARSYSSTSSRPSRNNSISSARSNGLSRMTSSSSSLNLNAYLTDESGLPIANQDHVSFDQSRYDKTRLRSNSFFSKSSSHAQSSPKEEPDLDADDTLSATDADSTTLQYPELQHYTSISDYLDTL